MWGILFPVLLHLEFSCVLPGMEVYCRKKTFSFYNIDTHTQTLKTCIIKLNAELRQPTRVRAYTKHTRLETKYDGYHHNHQNRNTIL